LANKAPSYLTYPALLGRLKTHGDNWEKVFLKPRQNRGKLATDAYCNEVTKQRGKKKRTPAILAPSLEPKRDPYGDYSIANEMAARAEAELAEIKERGYREWLRGDQQSSI